MRKCKSPHWMDRGEKGGSLKGFRSTPKITRAKCSNKKETPIAVIEGRDAWCLADGEISPRSMLMPSSAVSTMATGNVSHQGRTKNRLA